MFRRTPGVEVRRRSVFAWLCAALSLLSAGSSAMPAAAEREVLKNGIPVIFEHNDSSAITFLQLLVRGGKRAEPVEKQGLSFLATRLAAEVPDSGKAQELTRLAARFSVTSRGDFSLINIECLTVSLEPTLRILSRIVASPLFSGLRVDAIKKYMAHRSRMDEDDSLIVGHLAALSAFFGSAGYGGPAHGNEESLRAIKGKDASDFYRRHFSAANILLAVSSDLNKEEILSLLDSAFGSLPQGEPASFAPVALRIPGEKKIFIQRETKQSLVSRAFPLGRITPRGYVLNELLGNFLGKGSGSKLWPLRSEAKLAYNVDCRVTQMSEGGMLEAYLETD
ncbi:MAG: insulinase family protein, partial [Candidatus Aminicenantes bacterium]|nr:insulinase family protein [Candidatus Aminicenantes bacterium]